MDAVGASGGHVLPMDVTNDADLERVVRTILDQQGRIDVLVNNAGFGLYGAAEDVPLEQARYQLEVNLFGPARLTQLVLPHMRKQRSGTIVNVSSMGGEIAFPLGAWYHASKHALEAYSDALRQEVRRFGIEVVLIQPGLIKTEFGGVTSSSTDSCQPASSTGLQAARSPRDGLQQMLAVSPVFDGLGSWAPCRHDVGLPGRPARPCRPGGHRGGGEHRRTASRFSTSRPLATANSAAFTGASGPGQARLFHTPV